MNDALSIADLLAAAEPRQVRLLGGLVELLVRQGRLREVRLSGQVVGTTAVGGIKVQGLAEDSRRVRPGDVFVAVPGFHFDGHSHAVEAVRAGAVVIIGERPIRETPIAQLIVDRSPAALAAAACWWYGDPSKSLAVVGVTGTDGKTTTSFLVSAALDAAGLPAAMLGTVETRVAGVRERTAEHVTTPSALEVQRWLRAAVAGGDRSAVIETTSHGLAAERVAGIAYDAAIFTNLTHEHLEYHGSFEAYRAAKLSLFERLVRTPGGKPHPVPKVGVINRDDPAAPLFETAVRRTGARLVTYGLDDDADVRATTVAEDTRRLSVDVAAPGWQGRLALRIAGRFNVHNALAAVALGVGWGLDPEAVKAGLESVTGVPGRMERVDVGQPFAVIVDYAHSPAALEGLLAILAPVAAGSNGGLIAVFGSAGERDTAKRPMMGRIAGERCRLVVVTDEDPRGEDREAILREIAAGAEEAGRQRGKDLLLIADRAAALAAAFERARPGDVVVLAGKGHEQSIIGPDGPTPWDERSAALAALAGLGYSG